MARTQRGTIDELTDFTHHVLLVRQFSGAALIGIDDDLRCLIRIVERLLPALHRGLHKAGIGVDLGWIGKLDIRYDASTFDSDPFEPQPDGVQTIFPFWVHRPEGSAYLELPYTLPQDSTVFLVLREKNNDVWKRKLDWIAEQGGMAFVIVHPDYLAFEKRPAYSEYPVDLYQDFLEYVQKHYQDSAWFARPSDVEQYLRHRMPPDKSAPVQFQDSSVLNVSELRA